MDFFVIVELSLVIFGITAFLSLFGKGGGEFFVPIMLAFSVPFQKAATSSLFILVFSGLSMTHIYHKNKMINWPLVALLIVISSITSFIGGLYSHLIPTIYLKLSFSILLFISAIFIAKPIHKKEDKEDSMDNETKKWGGLYWKNTFEDDDYYINLLVLPIVAIIAFIAGSVGISGGGVIVPLLILIGGLPLRVAFAANAVLVFANSLAGFFGHGLAGEFDPMLAVPLGVAGFLGGQVGSRYAKRIHVENLRILFVLILLVAAVWMLLRALCF
ncbi:MAG: sulfite exporter TauE/SafE family protein [Candidatus Njordarchaeia archaeon]